MTLSPDVIDGLPYVEGVLNYLTPMAERPINLAYDPPLGVPRSTGVPEAHRMTIYDVRPVAARLSLDSEGLALVTHNSAVRDFYDEDELQRVYYPEAERLVAEVTGATRVLVFDHTVRRRVWGGVDRSAGTPRQPVTVVHNDYTIDSGPQRVRDLMGDDAGELLNHRFEIVNVWRPIRGPLRDAPLADCDATTSPLRTLSPPIWSTAIEPGRSTASNTTLPTAGSTHRRCRWTKRSSSNAMIRPQIRHSSPLIQPLKTRLLRLM